MSDIVEVESQPSTSVDLFSTTAGLSPFPVVNGKSGALAGSTPLGTRFRKTEPTNADLMKVMKEILSAIRELTDKKETRLDDPNYIVSELGSEGYSNVLTHQIYGISPLIRFIFCFI